MIFQSESTNENISHFDVISGSWGTSFGITTVTETTGSGIALARARTDGAGTEFLSMVVDMTPSGSLTVGDVTRYDIVFDWIDADNYQVLKWRGAGSAARPTIARIESGVETDLVTLAGCTPATSYYFVRNSSPAWLIHKPNDYSRTFFDELPQFGGTRFGVRSNNVGGSYAYFVKALNCYNTVDSAVDAIAKPLGYPGFAYNDAAKPGCLTNPDNSRCDKCIAWGPRSGEGQWMATIAGVTGNCASVLNGSHMIDCDGCGGNIYYNGVNCSADNQNVWLTVDLAGGRLAVAGSNPSTGAHYAFFPITDSRILNCYTDWPQTLGAVEHHPYSIWDPADADFTSATATLDLVF